MGRKVIYKCDLCREEKPHTDMKTIYWSSAPLPKKYILKDVQVNDPLDKQICNECIQMIKNFHPDHSK